MNDREARSEQQLIIGREQALLGVIVRNGQEEMIRYFAADADGPPQPSASTVERALSLAGAWSDLDWDEMEAELDGIRHATPPTPPIEL
jgi:hypothetical protein